MTRFAIIGAGNAGCAFAAHLKLLGHEVRLHDSFPAQLESLSERGGRILLEGNVPETGEAEIDLLTDDVAQLVEGADIILCTTPAHCHRAVAKSLAPHLTDGQILVLNPGRTCGALETRQALREHGAPENIIVVEAQTLLYACRRTPSGVHVFGLKDQVACAALPAAGLATFLAAMGPVLPRFHAAAQGLWQTSLDNIGMLFHPAPTLLNLSRMESGVPFDYYHDGFTPTVAWLVEQLDVERCAVARAMGIHLPTAVEWLHLSYGARGTSLREAILANTSYAGIQAPRLASLEAKLSLRYVVEDVPTGLVPVSALGARFGVPTPHIDLVTDLANALWQTDFRASGRNLERLGLAGLDREEILSL